MIEIQKGSTDELIQRVHEGKCYSTSRFGDGEWESALQLRPPVAVNCDGHRFFPMMGMLLRDALIARPRYMLGMQSFGLGRYWWRIEDFLKTHGLTNLPWYDADELAMHRLSQRSGMDRWFDALRNAHVLMVGPDHLRDLRQRIEWLKFIPVPRINSFEARGRIERRVLDAYSKAPKPLVISISMGIPAGVLVDKLFPKIGHDSFLLDMGSVYDFYVGKPSRGYQRRLARRCSRKIRR